MHNQKLSLEKNGEKNRRNFVRGTLEKKMGAVIRKIWMLGKQNWEELKALTEKIAPESAVRQEQPAIAILQYLLMQGPPQKEGTEMVKKCLQIFTIFFRAINITISPPLYIQLEALLQKYYEPLDKPFQVANLWNDSKNTLSCYCQLSEEKQKEEICYKCQKPFHEGCFWKKEAEKYHECPLCFARQCLPQKSVQQTIFVGYLEYLPLETVEYKGKFHFNMSGLGTSTKYQVRCLELHKKNRYSLTFPENWIIQLGGKTVYKLDAPSSESSSSSENTLNNQRTNKTVNIERHLLSFVNFLTVKINNKSCNEEKKRKNYLITIFSIKEFSNIPQFLKEKYSLCTLSKLKAKNMVKRVINAKNQNSDDRLLVHFRCQYFSTSIQTPVRSKQCTSHYQPFDLQNFITISLAYPHSKFSWHCPICKVRAYDLIVDQYLQDIIASNINIVTAEFDKEGELIRTQKEGEVKTITIDQRDSSPSKVSSPEKKRQKEREHENNEAREENQKEVKGYRLKRTYEERQLQEDELIDVTPRKISIRQYESSQTHKKTDILKKSEVQEFTQRVKNFFSKTANLELQPLNPNFKVSQATESSEKCGGHKIIGNRIIEKQSKTNQPTSKPPIPDSISQDSIEIMEANPLEGMLLKEHKMILKELSKGLKKGLTTKEKTSFNILTRKLQQLEWN